MGLLYRPEWVSCTHRKGSLSLLLQTSLLHHFRQLLLVLDDSVELTTSEQNYLVDKPSIIFINHLENHTFSNTSRDYRRYVIDVIPTEASIHLPDCDRLLSPFINRPESGSHIFGVDHIAAQLETRFHILYEKKTADDSEVSQIALLHAILQFLYRNLPNAFNFVPHSLTSIVREIQRRYDSAPFDEASLAELALEYHLSVSHLTHTFKMTTTEFCPKYRTCMQMS